MISPVWAEGFLFVLAMTVLVLKLRKDGNGTINTKELIIGTSIIASITFLLPLTGLKAALLGPVGGAIIYISVPLLVFLVFKFSPEVFDMNKKVITWVILGAMLTMSVIAIPGCYSPAKNQQEIEKQRDLPDLEKSKQKYVDPHGTGGNKNK